MTGPTSVTIYEIHFRDKEGQIHETEEFEAQNDVEAVTQAHVLFKKIWQAWIRADAGYARYSFGVSA